MDQKIFEMGLSVNATSAYILLESLAEADSPVTLDRARAMWNATPEELVRAVEELAGRKVIEPPSGDDHRIVIHSPAKWAYK